MGRSPAMRPLEPNVVKVHVVHAQFQVEITCPEEALGSIVFAFCSRDRTYPVVLGNIIFPRRCIDTCDQSLRHKHGCTSLLLPNILSHHTWTHIHKARSYLHLSRNTSIQADVMQKCSAPPSLEEQSHSGTDYKQLCSPCWTMPLTEDPLSSLTLTDTIKKKSKYVPDETKTVVQKALPNTSLFQHIFDIRSKTSRSNCSTPRLPTPSNTCCAPNVIPPAPSAFASTCSSTSPSRHETPYVLLRTIRHNAKNLACAFASGLRLGRNSNMARLFRVSLLRCCLSKALSTVSSLPILSYFGTLSLNRNYIIAHLPGPQLSVQTKHEWMSEMITSFCPLAALTWRRQTHFQVSTRCTRKRWFSVGNTCLKRAGALRGRVMSWCQREAKLCGGV